MNQDESGRPDPVFGAFANAELAQIAPRWADGAAQAGILIHRDGPGVGKGLKPFSYQSRRVGTIGSRLVAVSVAALAHVPMNRDQVRRS